LLTGIGRLVLRGSEGEAVLGTLEGDLREISTTQRLNEKQKAMVTACVSSQLISYSSNAIAKLLGPAAAVERFEGVCSEYAGIYARLARATGLESGLQGGTLRGRFHAWAWVNVNGRKLWVEPQTNPMRETMYFMDPEGEAPIAMPWTVCEDTGTPVGEPAFCCSREATRAGDRLLCAPPACEANGAAMCVGDAHACTDLGGRVAGASCGASVDGSTCCAFTR